MVSPRTSHFPRFLYMEPTQMVYYSKISLAYECDSVMNKTPPSRGLLRKMPPLTGFLLSQTFPPDN